MLASGLLPDLPPSQITVMGQPLRVAIIGTNFMGRAHSNAWLQAGKFFDVDRSPVLQVACGRNAETLHAFAGRWGWQHTETDWRRAVERDDVDVVDISLPQHLHHESSHRRRQRWQTHLFARSPWR